MPLLNAQALLALPYEQIVEVIRRWTKKNIAETQSWNFWRRDDQAEPLEDWRIWLVMAGRGYRPRQMSRARRRYDRRRNALEHRTDNPL